MSDSPTIHRIEKHAGIAGQYSMTAFVEYGEDTYRVTFTGSVYGGPIVMSTEANPSGVFVSRDVTDRLGSTLDGRWIRRFFGEEL